MVLTDIGPVYNIGIIFYLIHTNFLLEEKFK